MNKAISIKQPWAYLICAGIKDVENRTWVTKFRGRVYIHASAAKAEFNFTSAQYELFRKLNMRRWYNNDFQKSAIIGHVDIIDCVENYPSIWALPNHYHWVLSNPVLLDKPILNVKGKLSFWDCSEYFCKT